MNNDEILIGNNFTDQVNSILLPGETETIGNVMRVALEKNFDKIEISTCNEDKTNKGMAFKIRAKPGFSAVSVFKEELEKQILLSRQAIQAFKDGYKLAVDQGKILDPSDAFYK
jgi:DNA-directed RNA polymerase subunit L